MVRQFYRVLFQEQAKFQLVTRKFIKREQEYEGTFGDK